MCRVWGGECGAHAVTRRQLGLPSLLSLRRCGSAHSLTLSLTHPLSYSLTHSLTHPPTHSHPFTPSLTHPLSHSLYALTYSLTHSLYALIHLLPHSFAYSSTHLLTDSLTPLSLTPPLTPSQLHSFYPSVIPHPLAHIGILC